MSTSGFFLEVMVNAVEHTPPPLPQLTGQLPGSVKLFSEPSKLAAVNPSYGTEFHVSNALGEALPFLSGLKHIAITWLGTLKLKYSGRRKKYLYSLPLHCE